MKKLSFSAIKLLIFLTYTLSLNIYCNETNYSDISWLQDKQIYAVPDADAADDVGALPGAGADDHDADDAGADLSEVMCPLLLSERSDGGAVDSPSEKISLGNLKRYH